MRKANPVSNVRTLHNIHIPTLDIHIPTINIHFQITLKPSIRQLYSISRFHPQNVIVHYYIASFKVQFSCLPIGQNRITCRSTKRHVHACFGEGVTGQQ